jgi:site-specific recombinase XerD
MKGCRSFSDQEADLMGKSFSGPYAARDRAVFALGRFTGERISAILKIRVGDVVQDEKVADAVTYRRASRKGKIEGRTVKLHQDAKDALTAWINQLAKETILTADDYVFQSRKGQGPVGRVQYHRILKEAALANELTGKIATHSMRKTFADRVYEALGHDIFRTQKAMGHKNINSTVQYLSFKEADIDAAILAM